MESVPARHFLIPVDKSPASSKVFEYTLEHLYRPGDVIHLFHCIPLGTHVVYPNELGMEEVVDDDSEQRKDVEDAAKEYMRSTFEPKLTQMQAPYQIDIVRYPTDADSVGKIICKRAEELKAAMVIMAKHEKGALTEFFVGSSTKYCTNHCKSPVLVMHCD